ncbi:MAG: hypothetical protein IPP60_09570 [Sphingobacteriales bacterium]|nr:hypothetical protein [Sphingobacteriales bacterium]
MIKILSKILSYLFHPLLMTTWFTLLLLYTNPFSFAGLSSGIVIAVIFINTFMFPAISILLMRKLGFIEDLEMPDHKQRIIPLVASIIFYVWAYLATRKINFPYMMGVFMMGVLVSLFASFVINVFYKVSLHMVGVSGALTAIMLLVFVSPSDLSYYFLAMILLTGAVASARLYLGAHTIKEVYVGFLVGMFGQVFGLFLFHP